MFSSNLTSNLLFYLYINVDNEIQYYALMYENKRNAYRLRSKHGLIKMLII
jgi:hypothetical protein